ncbi:hypothetical protein [Proteus mirabilis]|uniref:hypothetical protein n=1 Tax=Proteus mirabilis TaxID=584 RepID=UPI003556D761
MNNLIQNAKNEIVNTNNEFGYVAGDLEIAAEIWHGYLSVEQRLEIMRANNITKSVKDAYKAIAEMMK